MNESIGLVETIGLAISIYIADAMLKASNVHLVNQTTVDVALVTVVVRGDVSSVQAAVEIGEEIAKRANSFVSSKVIANPDTSTAKLASEITKSNTVGTHILSQNIKQTSSSKEKNTQTPLANPKLVESIDEKLDSPPIHINKSE
ncbi:BMC domain-containing protein [Psychrobacillus soli]|uniref:BMC domain-containing protein n=1 Tax=Psychrobacillus soli TaxID=1543965 RepID=A0A544SU36_9BACI|nr:BMC domain-containing protein [Psychrobacillus soli]TQR08741.1 BMC domain-containing protein [Psychrobacillus soli]